MKTMTRIGRGAGAALITAFMMLSTPAMGAEDPRVAAEVIGLARAQWASELAGQAPAQQLVSLADDYTEFNADYPTLLVGKDMARRMLAIPYAKSMFADMQNPKVQVYGDTAILTYNFVGITRKEDGNGKASIAKSTRVYTRQDGKWMLVHANFAPVPGAPQ